MKITINIECTPAEARQYMGLPDVASLQEAMLREMQEGLKAHISSLHPAEMMKMWFPAEIEGWLGMQKAMWTQLASIGARNDDHT